MPCQWNILWLAGQLGRSGEMQRVGIGIIGWGDEEGEGTEAKTGLTMISTCQVSALARIGRSPSWHGENPGGNLLCPPWIAHWQCFLSRVHKRHGYK